jgi:hypothetical protein
MQQIHISTKYVALLCFAAVIISGYVLFNGTGALVLFAMALFLVVSPYAILRNFSLEEDEKWFFSLFIGLGMFSTVVWAIGRLMPLNVAIIVTMATIALVSFALHKYLKKPVQ